MRNITTMGLAVIVAATLAALPAARDRGAPKTIDIDGTRFRPVDITVSVNDAVEWVNKDPFPHNVTAKSGGFRSGNLPSAGKWQFRPRNRGTFEYVCTLHPGMKAVLHVR
jgi:plastocyanin